MNNVLLDTHALLWFLFDDSRLSQRAATVIEDPKVKKTISMASLWEIVIKTQLGKLVLGCSVDQFMERYVVTRELQILPIEIPHLLVYASLPLVHRDPFDRLLVAQATYDKLPVMTRDDVFAKYDMPVIW